MIWPIMLMSPRGIYLNLIRVRVIYEYITVHNSSATVASASLFNFNFIHTVYTVYTVHWDIRIPRYEVQSVILLFVIFVNILLF